MAVYVRRWSIKKGYEMRRSSWGTGRVTHEPAVGRLPGSRRHTRAVSAAAILLSALLTSAPAHAAFNGEIENLEEGYMIFQAVSACPLAASDVAMDILKAEIRRFEAGVNEGKRQKLWAEASADIPKAVGLGLCEVFDAELELIETIHATENPPPAEPKPVF